MLFHSIPVLQYATYCYAGVIQDTCNTSAVDINLLKTILYNAKFSRVVDTSCALGESQYGGFSTVHS